MVTFWQERGGSNINIYNRSDFDVRIHFKSAETDVRTSLKAFAGKLRRQKSFNGRIRVGGQLISWEEKYIFSLEDEFITKESQPRNMPRQLSVGDVVPSSDSKRPERGSAWGVPPPPSRAVSGQSSTPGSPCSSGVNTNPGFQCVRPPTPVVPDPMIKEINDILSEILLLCKLRRSEFSYIIRKDGRIVKQNTNL
jgi:hypothetical protein